MISLEQKFSGYAPGLFHVLELHSFLNGKIKGLDSPIYQPREIEIDVSQIQWEENFYHLSILRPD